jgi:hypothetical protein
LAFVGALITYGGSLTSPFFAEDYVYLNASRDLPFSDYLRLATDRSADTGTIAFFGEAWRPLTHLSFRGIYALFGGSSLAFHTVLLLSHLCCIGLVWVLARQLTGSRIAPTVAVLAFAVHPAGVVSISWVSALNSLALPLALGGWIAFTARVRHDGPGTWWRTLLWVLVISMAMLYRETAVIIVGAMVLWYLCIEAGGKVRAAATWRPLAPLAVLAAGYATASTRGFSVGQQPRASQSGNDMLNGYLYYLKQALPPFDSRGVGAVQALWVIAVAVVLVVAVRARRWPVVVLTVAFLVSLVPYGALNVNRDARYFYFPSVLLALALGAAIDELLPAIRARVHPQRRRLTAAVVAVSVTLILASVGHGRVQTWTRNYADVNQQWADGFRAENRTVPAHVRVLATSVPLTLGVFEAYPLEPTLEYYYPGTEVQVRVFQLGRLERVRDGLRPDDRIYIFNAALVDR